MQDILKQCTCQVNVAILIFKCKSKLQTQTAIMLQLPQEVENECCCMYFLCSIWFCGQIIANFEYIKANKCLFYLTSIISNHYTININVNVGEVDRRRGSITTSKVRKRLSNKRSKTSNIQQLNHFSDLLTNKSIQKNTRK